MLVSVNKASGWSFSGADSEESPHAPRQSAINNHRGRGREQFIRSVSVVLFPYLTAY